MFMRFLNSTVRGLLPGLGLNLTLIHITDIHKDSHQNKQVVVMALNRCRKILLFIFNLFLMVSLLNYNITQF